MTLGTILEKLGSLLAKPFLFGSFIPILLFHLGNGALLYAQNASFRAWADEHVWQGGDSPLRNTTLVFLGLILVAYVFSTLNTRLREILEGEGWWPSLAAAFVRRQRAVFDPLQAAYRAAHTELKGISENRNEWETELREARKESPKEIHCRYSENSAAASAINELRRSRDAGSALNFESLSYAFSLLKTDLLKYALEAAPASDEESARLLDADHVQFNEIAKYAETALREQVIEHRDKLEKLFPYDSVAPTAMGNIARSVGSYTDTRYGFNFDLLWSRLQKVLQGESYYPTVQDAKTQLDFLVSTLWLLGVSVVGWLVFFFLSGFDRGLFLLVAVGGPLAMRVLYLLCLQNYQAFAELLRSSVDLYRLELLKEFRLRLPDDSRQERELWKVVDRQIHFGESTSLPYEHGAG